MPFYLTPKQDDYLFDLVAFFVGPCCDGYVLRRVMDCGRLGLHSSLPALHNR